MLAPIAAKLLSVVIKRYDFSSEIPGLVPTTIVSLVLLFAWLAHLVGAPELLGGFCGGTGPLSRFFFPLGITLHADEPLPAASRTDETDHPAVHPHFLRGVGLSLNLREIDWGSPFIWGFSLTLLVVSIIGKLAGRISYQEPWPVRWVIGMAMVPRGEVGLIFAELGRVSGIFSNEVSAGMVIVIALTTLLSPLP